MLVESPLPRLVGDSRRFKQVLMNLVRNALKYTNSTGKVVIKASYLPLPDELLIVHVEDTGRGITQDEIPQLFTKFGKKARSSVAVSSEGIGLGLTMVKQIVESAGGQVGVQSGGRDKGSVFKISMKMQAVAAKKTTTKLHNSLLRMTNKNRMDEEEDNDD